MAARAVEGGPFDVRVRIECNYLVSRLALRADRRIVRVRRTPRVVSADGGALTCRRARRRPRVARCDGSFGTDSRVLVRLRVAGDPCEQPRLRLRVVGAGGLDCGNAPCPAIGLRSEASAAVVGC